MSSKVEKMRVGIVGMGRTAAFMQPVASHPHAELAAICDLDPVASQAAMHKYQISLPAERVFTEYSDMIEKGNLDLVIIGTPVFEHVPQSIIALAEDIHVFSEVPVTWSLDEAKQLVKAFKTSKATYMMGENSCYHRSIMTLKNIIDAGLLGYVHYAEGEYIHECLYLLASTPWRELLFGINGLVYTTHEIGPIMYLFDWDRINRLSATGSGSHFCDKNGMPYKQETRLTMQCQTEQGRLIRINQDFQSPGTHCHHRYVVQGVSGRFESGSREYPDQLMAASLTDDKGQMIWRNIQDLEEKYLPDIWRRCEQEARKHGHGGSDYVLIYDYLDSLWEKEQVPIDIWRSLDMSLPGIMSIDSLQHNGDWVDVPDPRNW